MILSFAFLALTQIAIASDADLHMHLFIDGGTIPYIYSGGGFGPLTVQDSQDKWGSKVNTETLKKSHLRLVVLALYAHKIGGWNLRQSIRNQIQQVRRFVSDNSEWILARDPHEAEIALQQGKRVLVLSLEGASGILENRQDLDEFIDREGIAIVTPVHFLDDAIGGASLMRGYLGPLMNPLGWIRSWWSGSFVEGVRANPQGLQQEGERLIQELLDRGVWPDLAHSSDATQDSLLALLEARNVPPLHSHTSLRHHHGAERAIGRQHLSRMAKNGGLLGLIPSQDMLEPATLEQHLSETFAVLGPGHIFWGTDYNAPIRGIPEAFRLDQLSDWVAREPKKFEGMGRAEDFVRSWKKVKKKNPTAGVGSSK